MTDLRALLGDKYDDVIQKAADAMDEAFLGRALDVYPWLAPEAAAALAAVLPDLLADAWAIGWMSGVADHAEDKCHNGLGTRNPYLPEGLRP